MEGDDLFAILPEGHRGTAMGGFGEDFEEGLFESFRCGVRVKSLPHAARTSLNCSRSGSCRAKSR